MYAPQSSPRSVEDSHHKWLAFDGAGRFGQIGRRERRSLRISFDVCRTAQWIQQYCIQGSSKRSWNHFTKSLPARTEEKDLYYYFYSMLYTQYQPSRSQSLPTHTHTCWSRVLSYRIYISVDRHGKYPIHKLARCFPASINYHGSVYQEPPPHTLFSSSNRFHTYAYNSAVRTLW